MNVLIPIALLIVYVGGVWKFWSGFKRTNFEKSFGNRVSLSLLWPILIISNRSYRQNFSKALKGSKR